MAERIIKIDKDTVTNQVANKSIDRSFSELIPKEDLVSLDQFFDYYNQLFYNIPRDGTLSHKTIIDQSTEYYGNYKNPLQPVVDDLQAQIDLLNNRLLDAEFQDSEGGSLLDEGEERTIKITLRLAGEDKLGKAKSRSKENYKFTFFNHEGEATVLKNSYVGWRDDPVFEFKTKPGTYSYKVFGFVDRAASKKDWVHSGDSGIKTVTKNSPLTIVEDFKVDVKKKKR